MSFFPSKKITRQALDIFLAQHATDARVLDIGSGGSSYHRFFPNRLTIDIDPARKPDIVADAHSLPCMSGEFSTVLCTEVLEHVSNPPQAIAEIYRVLEPGGTLILTTRFVYPIHDAPGDFFRYTRYGLEYLFKDWVDVSVEPEIGAISTIGALLQRIVFQCDVRGGRVTKVLLLLVAGLFTKLDWIIVRTYGDIQRTSKTNELITTGYYVVAHKP